MAERSLNLQVIRHCNLYTTDYTNIHVASGQGTLAVSSRHQSAVSSPSCNKMKNINQLYSKTHT